MVGGSFYRAHFEVWKNTSGLWARVGGIETRFNEYPACCPAGNVDEVYITDGNSVVRWNYQTGMKVLVRRTKATPVVLFYVSQRHLLLIGDKGGGVTLLDTLHPKRRALKRRVHSLRVAQLAGTEQDCVMSSSSDRTLRAWCLTTPPKTLQCSSCPAWVDAIAWNEEWGLLAAGGTDGLLRVWNTKRKLVFERAVHDGEPIFFLEFSTPTTLIVGYGQDRVRFERVSFSGDDSVQLICSGETRAAHSVFYTHDHELKCAQLTEEGLEIRKVGSGPEPAWFIPMTEISITAGSSLTVALSNNRQVLALCDYIMGYCEFRVYDVAAKTLRVRDVFMMEHPPMALAVANSGEVIVGTTRGKVGTPDDDGELACVVDLDADASVNALQFSESGRGIACGLADSRCFVLDRS